MQPTRIIERKRIQINFDFIKLLIEHPPFTLFLREHPELTITLLVTGPVANGHSAYLKLLLQKFAQFISDVPTEFQRRVFLAFPFGLENKPILTELGLNDLLIHEIYSVATMTLLPSSTEGRGLPIIESCASGVPMFCHRYRPEHVYSDVIGEKLEESLRLRVFEFQGDTISNDMITSVAKILIDPKNYKEMSKHNREVVSKRYSMQSLTNNLNQSLFLLWNRAKEDKRCLNLVKESFKIHKKMTKYDKLFGQVVLSQNRKYIPGISITEFMVYLKSLIDPSFFRVEEMELRGRLITFAQNLLKGLGRKQKIDEKERVLYYKCIDVLLTYYSGSDALAIDHSISYRHRYRRHYHYRKLTEHEICGVVGILFRKIFTFMKQKSKAELKFRSLGHFKSIESSLKQLVGGNLENLAINDSVRILDDLKSQKDFGYFNGNHFKEEVHLFVLGVLKDRLGLSPDHELEMSDLTQNKIQDVGAVTLFVRDNPIDNITFDTVIRWIKKNAFYEIRMLYECKLFKVAKTEMLSIGIHLGQLGKDALMSLNRIKQDGGFVIGFGENAFMLDMIDMTSYRLGWISNKISASIMDLKIGDTFIQWVPAGLKPSLAYPTPIQTPMQFYQDLNSEKFEKCVTAIGEQNVLKILREDSDQYGNPVAAVLQKILTEHCERSNDKSSKSKIFASQINGIHADELPWTGALVKVSLDSAQWNFQVFSAGDKAQTVLALIEQFEKIDGRKVTFAWNGGYILNPELVGKLGLSEDYIGSPLGFICKNSKILAPPLYNKSAILVGEQGNIEIRRINLKAGLTIISESGQEIEFTDVDRNRSQSDGPIFYDLLYKKNSIHTDNRVIYRLAGNRVIEIIKQQRGSIPVIPVGLIISLPEEKEMASVQVGSLFNFRIPGLEDCTQGIEAGPLLLKSKKININMEVEGWKTENSIRTQAARLDFINMRGPKIGVAITDKDELIIIAINGRIRESVGATHEDLANILKSYGGVNAMGFDPGGSVTLVVQGEQVNISPYNPDYEDNILSLPPKPRMVGNAILGLLDT